MVPTHFKHVDVLTCTTSAETLAVFHEKCGQEPIPEPDVHLQPCHGTTDQYHLLLSCGDFVLLFVLLNRNKEYRLESVKHINNVNTAISAWNTLTPWNPSPGAVSSWAGRTAVCVVQLNGGY